MIWRRWLFHNFGWKLGSLVMAVLLWFAIVGEPELVTTHAVPILYRNLPGDLLIGSDAQDSVRVELRGPSAKLSEASLSDLAVMLDLRNVSGPGERTFTLADSDLRLPEGVALLRAIPSQLRLRFARRITRDVPVTIRFASALPAGYRIIQQEVFPAVLRISGPEQRVDAVAGAETDAIDLSAVTKSSEFHVNTFVADPQVWLESPPLVTVRVTIDK